MRSNKQQFSWAKLIKRVVVVTLVLALIEVIIIYFIMSDKKEEPVSKQATQIKTEQPAEIKNDSIVATLPPAQPTPAITEEAKPIETETPVTTTDTIAKVLPPEKKKEEPVKKPPLVEKVVEKNLSQQEMTNIVDKVNAAKGSKDTKCIQIRKSKNSNVKNAFDVGNYLKAKGYIISGREITSSNNNGVVVDASGACIKLTIGKME